MKTQDEKNEEKREKSIDQAISPPRPQVQCIPFDPETQFQKYEEKERKEKSEGGRCSRGEE